METPGQRLAIISGTFRGRGRLNIRNLQQGNFKQHKEKNKQKREAKHHRASDQSDQFLPKILHPSVSGPSAVHARNLFLPHPFFFVQMSLTSPTSSWRLGGKDADSHPNTNGTNGSSVSPRRRSALSISAMLKKVATVHRDLF